MLELQLFGPPVLRIGADPIAIPTRKALGLVAYLALEGSTPRSRLAGSLWPGAELDRARAHLRRELNRLRHTAVGEHLEVSADRVGLLAPFACDVHEFSRMMDAHEYKQALALHRGPLLDGFEVFGIDGFDAWLARWRASLSERMRSALALRARELEEAGELRAALDCHLELIRLDETQESYHREAMRLHHLVGERQAALARFAELKRVLRRALALEPLPETLELYRAIAAAKDVPRRSGEPALVLPARPPLIGRKRELSELEKLGTPSVLLLGDPGVGKTRLAEAAARSQPGPIVLRATEAASPTPLYPVAATLRALLGDPAARERIQKVAPPWRREAARLAPELEPDSGVESVREETRSRFHEGLLRVLCAASGPHAILLFDDVQWLDASSVELLQHCVRRARALEVRVFMTARPIELRATPAASLIDALEREGLSTTLRVEPLSKSDVTALLRAVGDRSTALAEPLLAATGGNPLFILETLKSLAATGRLLHEETGFRLRDPDAELALPRGVRDAVVEQVERLGPKVLRLAEALALAGVESSLDDLTGATGLPAFDAVDALERGLDAGLFARGTAGVRFQHDLLSRALAERIGEERRRLIHGKLADGLAARAASAARVAEHLVLAGRATEAISVRLEAAEQSLRVFALRAALEQYGKLLELPLDRARAFEVHERRARVERVLDDRGAWQAEVERLELLASEAGEPALSSRAALARAALENSTGDYERARASATQALAGASDDVAKAEALLESARAWSNLGKVAVAREELLRAAELAPESELTSEIERALCASALEQNELELAREHNERARQADALRGDVYGSIVLRMNDGILLRRAGKVPAAIEALETALGEAREAELPALERQILLALSSAFNLLGDYAHAAELARRGVLLATEPADPMLEARFENALAAFEYSLGNVGSSLAHSERGVAIAERIQAAYWSAFLRLGLAHTYLELGEHERALESAERARETVETFVLDGQRVVAETHVAHAELHLKSPESAVARLERALSSGAPPSMDPDHTFSVLALGKLLSGDAEAALAVLARHEFRPIHRSRALAVELDALGRLGRNAERELASALALLEDPRLTPVESLELFRAVLRAQARRNEARDERATRARAWRNVEKVALSLGDRPELRAAFLERNQDLFGEIPDPG